MTVVVRFLEKLIEDDQQEALYNQSKIMKTHGEAIELKGEGRSTQRNGEK